MSFGRPLLHVLLFLLGTVVALAKTTQYGYNIDTNVLERARCPNDTETVQREYTYDAWGRPLTTTGDLWYSLSQYNPLRYRGCVYDRETELYYLQSRYYNPEWGRFLNADSLMASVGGNIKGNNLFSYCFNNPLNMVDRTGKWPKWLDDAKDWFEDNIVNPVTEFFEDIAEDCNNYDKENEDEQIVLDSNYFSSYKGTFVIRTNGNRSGSFGIIFLTRETNSRSNPKDVVRHEFGHTMQLKKLGLVKFAICIGIPSWQNWGTGDYYSKPWEITADIYGGVKSRVHNQADIDAGFAYLNACDEYGILAWWDYFR